MGFPADIVVGCLKKHLLASQATTILKDFRFRIVQELKEGMEVKTQYGFGTILELRGIEGVPGFSLVVQLGSWVLAGGQKPLLYCEADEVISVKEDVGALVEGNKRINSRGGEVAEILTAAHYFLGGDQADEYDDDHEHKDDGNRRSRRTRRQNITMKDITDGVPKPPTITDEKKKISEKVSVYCVEVR